MYANRSAFTLIELLVVIALMAVMITMGVVNVESSREASRAASATRTVMAAVRRARSMALITQKPVVLTYSNGQVDGEACANVEIQADKLFTGAKAQPRVWNLAGDVVIEEEPAGDASFGHTVEDVLSPSRIPEDVMLGLKIKALDESQELVLEDNEAKRSKISIFSTADNLSRTLTASSAPKTPEKPTGEGDESSESAAEDDAPLKVAFAANGTVDPPHRVWVYREGTSPDKGLCIHVDRFGGVSCDKKED